MRRQLSVQINGMIEKNVNSVDKVNELLII